MLRKRLEKANTVAQKASSTWDTFRKERDFHRMHHKRVMQVHTTHAQMPHLIVAHAMV